MSGPPLTEPATPLVTARLPMNGATALVVLSDGDSCVAATDYGLFVVSLSTGGVVPISERSAGRLCLTPDGRLVTAGRSEVLVWDPGSWTVVRRLTHQGGPLTDVAATDEFVVAGGWGGAWVWETGTGRRRHTLMDGEVMAVAVSADGTHAATAERNRRVMLWDLRQGTAVRMLRRTDPRVTPIDWNRPVDWDSEPPLDEAYRATALVDPTAGRLAVADGALAAGPLAEEEGLVPWGTTSRTRVIAVRHSDGVVAAAVDERIHLLNRDGELVAVLGPTFTPVTALVFAPDGRLVSAQAIGHVTVWPVPAGRHHPPRHTHTTGVWRTVIDRTGRYGRSIGRRGGGTLLWDLHSGRNLTGSGLEATLGQDSWFLPGGTSMLAEYGAEPRLGSEDGGCAVTVEDLRGENGRPRTKTVCCRDLPGGEVRWNWTPAPVGEGTRWWSPAWVVLPRHSTVVLVCTKDDDRSAAPWVVVLDQATGERLSRFRIAGAHKGRPQALPDGSVCLLFTDYSRTPTEIRLSLLDWRTGRVTPYAGPIPCVNALINADGLIVALAGTEIRLVDPAGGQPVARVAVPAELEVASLSISPDGRVILAGDQQGGVHILRTPGGTDADQADTSDVYGRD